MCECDIKARDNVIAKWCDEFVYDNDQIKRLGVRKKMREREKKLTGTRWNNIVWNLAR